MTNLQRSNTTPTGLTKSSKPNAVRDTVVAFLGEFIGTFMFLFFAFAGTQVANTIAPKEAVFTYEIPNTDGRLGSFTFLPNNASNLIYIALSFGMSLAVNVWVFFRISGGIFNPAVSRSEILSPHSTWAHLEHRSHSHWLLSALSVGCGCLSYSLPRFSGLCVQLLL